MFTLIVPGRLPEPFVVADAEGTQFVANVADANLIENIVIALSGPNPIPQVVGQSEADPIVGAIYVASNLHPDNFQFLGRITNEVPSVIIPVVWPSNERGNTETMQIGIALVLNSTLPEDPPRGRTVISSKTMGDINMQLNEFVQKVAMDLWRFVQSFSRTDPSVGVDYIVVPTSVLDRWMVRVEGKTRADPEFWRKVSISE